MTTHASPRVDRQAAPYCLARWRSPAITQLNPPMLPMTAASAERRESRHDCPEDWVTGRKRGSRSGLLLHAGHEQFFRGRVIRRLAAGTFGRSDRVSSDEREAPLSAGRGCRGGEGPEGGWLEPRARQATDGKMDRKQSDAPAEAGLRAIRRPRGRSRVYRPRTRGRPGGPAARARRERCGREEEEQGSAFPR